MQCEGCEGAEQMGQRTRDKAAALYAEEIVYRVRQCMM